MYFIKKLILTITTDTLFVICISLMVLSKFVLALNLNNRLLLKWIIYRNFFWVFVSFFFLYLRDLSLRRLHHYVIIVYTLTSLVFLRWWNPLSIRLSLHSSSNVNNASGTPLICTIYKYGVQGSLRNLNDWTR